MSEPIDKVLLRTSAEDFTPEHPRRPPWLQPTVRSIEYASTGDVATVPLAKADRANLHGLGRREREQPEDYEDIVSSSWGVEAHAQPAA
jgi:hypothetical protein